jgi:hypothetical protein
LEKKIRSIMTLSGINLWQIMYESDEDGEPLLSFEDENIELDEEEIEYEDGWADD